MEQDAQFHIDAALGGLALGSALKRLLPDRSWSQVKRLIGTRHVLVNESLAIDPARELSAGDRIDVLRMARPKPADVRDVQIVYLDEHLIVVDKPPRVIAVRRAEEMDWPAQRKLEQPTLDELLDRMLRDRAGAPPHVKVQSVHRLDRDTSGLMLFALSAHAEQALTRRFRSHAIDRNYLAIVHGHPAAQRIESWFVRDRGDGLRGSTPLGPLNERARRAVTYVEPLEPIGPCSLVRCRLETGRTHQIRIHLMERGHMVCGDRTYTHQLGEPPRVEEDVAPRQALHSSALRFTHPISGRELRFESPLPEDLTKWIERVRTRGARRSR
jgi:23S rRNA pseudouridine1911/1915/1917 synthase